ncbi:MAG: tRNA (adenosine(37)-N6)-threonylcarbamoyltransferase complex dimerization subunit type 1 TsaB [Deltaproteobacteria bacterium]|nr:MAG: tRNA (adenosine(37)-N6)-threonylcarbamoyltransferase complex dimerization subunit type 1 TsaB [Deltaproteobacteria bacterium]
MKELGPLILAFDTATTVTSVALTLGDRRCGRVLAGCTFSSQGSHSRKLLGAITSLLQGAGVDWSQIDGIGVCSGPGSFTGLRIGMATAKGLAFASKTTLLGASTLDSLAAGCELSSSPVCAVLDARKKEVYAALYRRDEDARTIRIGAIGSFSPAGLVQQIEEPTLMVGDGVLAYADFFRRSLAEKMLPVPPLTHQPSAGLLGLLCAEKLLQNQTLGPDAVPLYVRSSDAELNFQRQRRFAPEAGGAAG